MNPAFPNKEDFAGPIKDNLIKDIETMLSTGEKPAGIPNAIHEMLLKVRKDMIEKGIDPSKVDIAPIVLTNDGVNASNADNVDVVTELLNHAQVLSDKDAYAIAMTILISLIMKGGKTKATIALSIDKQIALKQPTQVMIEQDGLEEAKIMLGRMQAALAELAIMVGKAVSKRLELEKEPE